MLGVTRLRSRTGRIWEGNMSVHKGVGHYGAPITLDQAKKAMAAAEAKAKQNNWNVVISIVDSGGHIVVLQRPHRTQPAALLIAGGKAPPPGRVLPADEGPGGGVAGGGAGVAAF